MLLLWCQVHAIQFLRWFFFRIRKSMRSKNATCTFQIGDDQQSMNFFSYSAWRTAGWWYSCWEAANSWCSSWHHLHSNPNHLYKHIHSKASRLLNLATATSYVDYVFKSCFHGLTEKSSHKSQQKKRHGFMKTTGKLVSITQDGNDLHFYLFHRDLLGQTISRKA